MYSLKYKLDGYPKRRNSYDTNDSVLRNTLYS
jgi:hypothetical protein